MNGLQTFFITAAICTAATFTAHAQVASYPDRPIRVIVPFPAGGPVDIVARKIGAQLSVRMGQPVVVENRPGANTIIGAEAVAKSSADGYTLLMTNTGVVQNPWLYKELPYDLNSDLAPVAQVLQAPLVLTVNGGLPISNIKSLVDYEKNHAGKTAYASTSIGGTTNIYGEQLKRLNSLSTIHVPYKGDASVLPDLLANRIQWYFGTASQIFQYVESGRLRPLAVTGNSRLARLPDVPTMAEAGLDSFDTVAWYGVFLPKKTPKAIVDRLGNEILAIVRGSEMTSFLTDNMFVPAALDSDDFATVVNGDLAKWKDLIQKNNIKIE